MPRYSSSPLGLELYSDSDNRGNNVGSYVISGSASSRLKSLFSDSETFSFSPSQDYNADISTTSIIDYTSRIPSMKLKYSDFAYLRNLGVYPNNRLIIARRFDSPVHDDLTSQSSSPISTLISWLPDNKEFISAEFGEEWDSSESSFRKILNELGNDVLMGDNSGKNLGDFLGGGAGVIPLAGFTEGLQYEVFKKLGLSDLDATKIPSGNPNLIRESKKRKTLDKETAGSGLQCKFKIEMSVEYEQKFINGVDPTIVYYDIIANALTFGTSEAQFQFKSDSAASSEFERFINKLGSGDPKQLKEAMLQFVTAVSTSIGNIGNKLISMLTQENDKSKQTAGANNEEEKERISASQKDDSYNIGVSTLQKLIKIATKIVAGLVNKYKVRIIGVVNSLTGSPSAPWHVTVGNPRRPIFSSGDMLVESVKLSMGRVLSFNDLPASLKLDFTLTSARNLGSQEIYKKFNCGKERTYKKMRSAFVESDVTFTDNEVNQSVSNQKMSELNKNATVGGYWSDGTLDNNKINKVGQDVYPDAVKSIPNIQYLTGNVAPNGDRPVIASGKINTFVKNTSGQYESQSKSVEFWPDGKLYIINDNGTQDKGKWRINADGDVEIIPDNDRFKQAIIK